MSSTAQVDAGVDDATVGRRCKPDLTTFLMISIALYMLVMPLALSHALCASCGWLSYRIMLVMEPVLARKFGPKKKLHGGSRGKSGSSKCDSETSTGDGSSRGSSSDTDERDGAVTDELLESRAASRTVRHRHPHHESPPKWSTTAKQACHLMDKGSQPKRPEWEVKLDALRQIHEGGYRLTDEQQAELERCQQLEEHMAHLHAERVVHRIGGILLVRPGPEAADDEEGIAMFVKGKGKGKGKGKHKGSDMDPSSSDPLASGGLQGEEGKEDDREPQSEEGDDDDGGLWDFGLAEPELRELPPPRIAEETAMQVSEHDDICWEWARQGWCARGAGCQWQHPVLCPAA